MDGFMHQTEEAKKNPESKYDALIYKQNCVNDTVAAQVRDFPSTINFPYKSLAVMFTYWFCIMQIVICEVKRGKG